LKTRLEKKKIQKKERKGRSNKVSHIQMKR